VVRLGAKWGFTLVVVLGLSWTSACTHAGTEEGTALAPANTTFWSLSSMPPGEQRVLMSAFLRNESGTAIALRGVKLVGDYESVLDILRVEYAPLPGSEASYDFTPGGIFKNFPPALRLDHRPRCNVQRLVTFDGATMAPGAFGRIMVLIRASRPGRFRITAHDVSYEQDGRDFHQQITVGARGSVRRGARGMLLPREEKPCQDVSRVLP
jgi:hypothetical protein